MIKPCAQLIFKGAFNNLRFQLEACMNINQLPKCFKKAKVSIKEHGLRFLGEGISKLDIIFKVEKNL